MSVWCLLWLLVVVPDASSVPNRIVGGHPVRIQDYPYQLLLLLNNQRICGASLIDKSTALTAAHCVQSRGTYSIRAGSSYPDRGGVIIQISNAILHPSFQKDTNDNDICLLKLQKSISFGPNVAPVLLPTQNQRVATGTRGRVSGFGQINPYVSVLASKLTAVEVPVISREECQWEYAMLEITPRMLCAGYRNGGRDSCRGDSGGPLVVNGVQVGIVSWGLNCAEAYRPGVYTNVAMFRDFIDGNK